MRWEGDRESSNVEDLRGQGGGGGFGFGGRSVGIGTIVIALIGSWFFGVSPGTILNLLTGGGAPTVQQAPQQRTGPEDEQTRFVRTVLAYTEDTWTEIFREHGGTYKPPTLTIFENATRTGCGTGRTAAGPFYCPADQHVYIDLAFYNLMRQRFHESGEFAQAYVIAHEVGHHVQNLMGIMDKVDRKRQAMDEAQANALSVRVELQADCFAGVWGNRTNQAKNILEQGDVESALHAATAIGDDTLQRQSQGVVVPDSFTHGTSAQRVRWFKRGIDSGDVRQCDTFGASQL
ncbi:neutral zinc metallopeptidase [Massilia agilis]|uniref:Neutral zinc metallopeptidase n=1 Tax=Massilia agilis TaxID=1811226 RepID=A0ABT2DA60_9BURK|nr:neutral zinc metallopeptidase [Massilia agilis]MCS0808186.1 neutral zinc metallopeptidase [Massilia agilis]